MKLDLSSEISQNFENTVKLSIQKMEAISPSLALSEKIIATINHKKRTRVLFKLFVFGVLSVLSLFGFSFMIYFYGPAILNSEFINLLSLLFTDFFVVMTFWREYFWGMAAAVPIGFGLALVASMLISILSVQGLVRTGMVFNHRVANHI